MSIESHTPPTVLETVDHDTRQAIINLNQKLNDLKDEIAAKIAAIEGGSEEKPKLKQEQLLHLAHEVGQALQGINNVVNTVISEETTPSEFLELHQEELNKFREMVVSNTKRIEKINKSLG